MRITTHNTFTDVITILFGVLLIAASVFGTFFMLSIAFTLIAGAFACAPSL